MRLVAARAEAAAVEEVAHPEPLRVHRVALVGVVKVLGQVAALAPC